MALTKNPGANPVIEECANCCVVNMERYADGADVTLTTADLLAEANAALAASGSTIVATHIYTAAFQLNAPNSDSADGTFTSGATPDMQVTHMGETVDYDSSGEASICKNEPLKNECARDVDDYLAADLTLLINADSIVDICVNVCQLPASQLEEKKEG